MFVLDQLYFSYLALTQEEKRKMTKRVRMDGQISKEEYDWNLHNDADDSSDPFTRLKDAVRNFCYQFIYH